MTAKTHGQGKEEVQPESAAGASPLAKGKRCAAGDGIEITIQSENGGSTGCCEAKKKKEGDEEEEEDKEKHHPLNSEWTLWLHNNPTRAQSQNWSDFQREVSTFKDVEMFWYIYEHTENASDLATGASYYLFKKGIKPEWEDPANRNGGRWLLQFDRKERSRLHILWQEVMMCLIGEWIDDFDDVCGAAVVTRTRADKISIWTTDWTHQKQILAVGYYIKSKLQYVYGPGKIEMMYEKHDTVPGSRPLLVI